MFDSGHDRNIGDLKKKKNVILILEHHIKILVPISQFIFIIHMASLCKVSLLHFLI